MGSLRSQAGLELIFIMAALSIGIVFGISQMNAGVQEVAQERSENSFKNLAQSIKTVQLQGNDASETVEVFIPDNVVGEKTRFGDGSISLALSENGNIKEIVVPVEGCFNGEIPTQPGYHQLTIHGGNCASIGYQLFEIEPSRISEWLNQGEQTTEQISIDTNKQVLVTVEVDSQLTPYIDLNSSQPGMQSKVVVQAPTNFEILITIPLGSTLGDYSGSIKVSSLNGIQAIPTELHVYSSSLELKTYIDKSRSRESDYFYVDGPLYFRSISRRNGQLFSTNINFTLADPSQVLVDQAIESAPTGILDAQAQSLGEMGAHNLTAQDMVTGKIQSKIVQAVRPISWKLLFDTGSFAPHFSSEETSGSIRFQLQDQAGQPITGLVFNSVQPIVTLSSDGWKYYQESCHGADACTPSECPVSIYLEDWYKFYFDDSTWDETTLPHTKYEWTSIDSTRVYRKHFSLSNVDKITGVKIDYNCDEGCECYINTQLVEFSSACQTNYPPQLQTWTRTDSEFLGHLNEGDNVIACRVVEKKYSQTSFRYFDAELSVLYDDDTKVELKRMLSSAPSLGDYLTITEQGDWYDISFNPQQLSDLSQGGDGEYVLYVETNHEDVPVENSISFNIGEDLNPEKAYRVYLEHPKEPNVNHAALDAKILVFGQTGLRLLDHGLKVRIREIESGNQIKQCIIEGAGGDEFYHCFVPQTGFEVNKTYGIFINDEEVKPQGLKYSQTFNIVTSE